MAFEIRMPQLGLTMEEGTVTSWAVKEGDTVKKDDVLLEVTTDKLSNEIQSEYDGTILKLVAKEGEDYKVKDILAYVGEPGEVIGSGEEVKAEAKEKKVAAPAEANSLIVIGGGPGGYVAAIRAAQLDAKVTLIEKTKLGGTCLNRGCMPTKAMLHASEIYKNATTNQDIGIIAENVKVDWEKVQLFRGGVVEKLTGGVKTLLKANKVNVIEGEAEFIGAKTVSVNGEAITADKIIIATGSQPKLPPIPGIDCPACIDSTQCLSLDHIPESMAVIGGGVIGIELGSVYARYGTKVTVLEAADRILPLMDGELTAMLTSKLNSTMEIHTSARVRGIVQTKKGAEVSFSSKKGEHTVQAEKVLVCTGREVVTAPLKLENAGVKVEKGYIAADDMLRTSADGIYAVGDCTGKLMLAHAAMAMGEIAAENAMGGSRCFVEDKCPSCAYVGPEFAGIGYTEERAKACGIRYKVGKFPTSGNGKSLVLGCTDGMVKVITGEKYGEVLGVHILAPNATELISQATLAIDLEATADELNAQVYPHPSVSESIHEAFLASEKRAIHIPNIR